MLQHLDRIWIMHEGALVANDVPAQALSADILADVFRISAPKDGFQSPALKGG